MPIFNNSNFIEYIMLQLLLNENMSIMDATDFGFKSNIEQKLLFAKSKYKQLHIIGK